MSPWRRTFLPDKSGNGPSSLILNDVSLGGSAIPIEAVIDTGAAYCFVPQALVAWADLQVIDTYSDGYILADGTVIDEGKPINVVRCAVGLAAMSRVTVPAHVRGQDVLLGMPWLNAVNVSYGRRSEGWQIDLDVSET